MWHLEIFHIENFQREREIQQCLLLYFCFQKNTFEFCFQKNTFSGKNQVNKVACKNKKIAASFALMFDFI